MNGRTVPARLARAVILSVLVSAVFTSGALAHHPDPAFGGSLFAQNQLVEYRWTSGQVPPAWMREAINNGAEDSNSTRRSKAAVFAYDTTGASSIAYDEPTACGALGAACANRSGAPNSFKLWFRRQGWEFDWGAMRWCEAYAAAPNGCYEAEAIALHEFGHAQILNHHEVLEDESDYLSSVMNFTARTKPKAGYNAHSYARCDVATLQRKYDVPSYATKIALCQSLDTYLTLVANDTSIGYRDPVTFTAVLRITDLDAYGRLGYNPLSDRTVTLQRRPPGTTTWQVAATMTDLASGLGYLSTQTPSITYEWRAVFSAPADEGIQGAVSPTMQVTVAPCTGSPCPTGGGND